MRARGWVWCVLTLLAASPAIAEPKPLKVDNSPFRKVALVLKDSGGNIYVVKPAPEPRLFYGTEKGVYEQVLTGRSANGDAWQLHAWAPRVPEMRPGTFLRNADGTFSKQCDGRDDHQLTQLTGEKAKAILEKTPHMSTALIRRPHMLARDDSGVYYYVDVVRNQYGGNGHRVFVGKKGTMKQLALTDVASDSAGDVFATKTGDLRLVRDGTTKATWIKGERKRELITLDVDVNSRLIFRDLGIYKFLGTICDSI
jgi:hypothetical protein